MTFEQMLQLAVQNARNLALQRDPVRGGDLYDTWHQHNATKQAVFDQFYLLANARPPHERAQLLNELDARYGTGASLYFA